MSNEKLDYEFLYKKLMTQEDKGKVKMKNNYFGLGCTLMLAIYVFICFVISFLLLHNLSPLF